MSKKKGLTSMAKVSPQIAKQVAEIAALHRNKAIIDSKAEMEKLGKLLNGTMDLSDVDKQFIEQKLEEGRKNTSNRIDKNLKGKVSEFIKNFISKTASLEGDKNKIDGEEEIKIVESYLKENRNNLSKNEVEYIENELFKGSNDIPKMPQIKNKKTQEKSEFGL